MSSYWLIRCPTCHKFTYTDQSGSWKLCPSCGEVISLSKAPIYLETSKPSEAEDLISAVEQYLRQTDKTDLTKEEVALVRQKYNEWLKYRRIQAAKEEKFEEVVEAPPVEGRAEDEYRENLPHIRAKIKIK